MILEARKREALREVLIVASALSVQDVRDRPLEQQQAADQAHAKFDDDKSEFLGDAQALELARAFARRPRRASACRAASTSICCATTSSRRGGCANGATSMRSCSRSSPSTAGASTPASRPTSSCTSRCSPGCSATSASRATRTSRTSARAASASGAIPARGCRRSRAAGSSPPSWSRRPGSTRAASPRSSRAGCPELAGHLIKTQLLEPHWEKKAAQVVALERATLYGIVIYANKRVDFGNVDPAAAREIFIREALVGGEWETQAALRRAPTAS